MKIEPLSPPGTCEANVELRATTLAELGQDLPHGLWHPQHGYLRSATFRPPLMGLQKQLGALRTRKDLRNHPGRYAAYYLATAMATLGSVDLAAMKEDARALLVAALPIGDVLYLLLRYQFEVHEDGLRMPGATCGACGHEFERIRMDVATVACSLLPETDRDGQALGLQNPPRARVALRRGLPWPKDGRAMTVLVRPVSWLDAHWNLQMSEWLNPGLMAAHLIRAGICGADSAAVPAMLPVDVVDELWPVDHELIDEAMDRITPSPEMRLEVDCPACRKTNEMPINWRDPDFFGSSVGA